MIKITFPDNSVKEYAEGTTAMQIAESISSRLAQEVLAASVNGEIWDLTRPINQDAAIKLFKWEDEEGKHAFWHSSAHLMAEACRSYIPASSSVSDRLLKTGSIMMWIRVKQQSKKVISLLSKQKCSNW